MVTAKPRSEAARKSLVMGLVEDMHFGADQVGTIISDLKDNMTARLMMLTQLFSRIVDRRQFAQVRIYVFVWFYVCMYVCMWSHVHSVYVSRQKV